MTECGTDVLTTFFTSSVRFVIEQTHGNMGSALFNTLRKFSICQPTLSIALIFPHVGDYQATYLIWLAFWPSLTNSGYLVISLVHFGGIF